jgi:hypothetical protein
MNTGYRQTRHPHSTIHIQDGTEISLCRPHFAPLMLSPGPSFLSSYLFPLTCQVLPPSVPGLYLCPPLSLSARLPVRHCHHFTEAMSASIQHDVLGSETLLHIIIYLCDVMADVQGPLPDSPSVAEDSVPSSPSRGGVFSISRRRGNKHLLLVLACSGQQRDWSHWRRCCTVHARAARCLHVSLWACSIFQVPISLISCLGLLVDLTIDLQAALFGTHKGKNDLNDVAEHKMAR